MSSTRVPVALVTGSGSGLGRALVTVLTENGWRVAGLDRAGATGDLTFDVDVTDRQAVAAAVSRTAEELGGIEALVTCAGVFPNASSPVHAIDDSAWDLTIGVNLTGSFVTSRAVLPHLIESKGTAVLVSSTAADHSQPGGAAYAASKAGVRALARSIALEYATHGVRACSVSPGYMETGMTAAMLSRDDILAEVTAGIPLGRVSDAGEVARTIAFLVGPDAQFLTGENITVDGGGGLMAYAGRNDVARMWSRLERQQQRAAAPQPS